MEVHGMSYTRVYRIWIGMKGRCLNAKHPKFHAYGAKGINVCKRWLIFANFLTDMGEPPTAKHSIDRKDGKLGYCPENCRWATAKEQSANTISCVNLTHNGKTQNMREWQRETGIADSTIFYRLKRGWTVEQALTLPAWSRVK